MNMLKVNLKIKETNQKQISKMIQMKKKKKIIIEIIRV